MGLSNVLSISLEFLACFVTVLPSSPKLMRDSCEMRKILNLPIACEISTCSNHPLYMNKPFKMINIFFKKTLVSGSFKNSTVSARRQWQGLQNV